MRNIKQYYILLFLTLFASFSAEIANAQTEVHVFPDRSSCVSGDTIWFSTLIIPEKGVKTGNVVHVQLDNSGNRHITKVSVLCNENQGQGYIPIPDSLSTGTYLLKAFISGSKNKDLVIINQRLLTVYNRFDEELSLIKLPKTNKTQKYDLSDKINILTDNESFETRKKIKVKIDIPQEETSKLSALLITAGIEDPFSENSISQYFPVNKNGKTISPYSVIEKNGVLVNGKVLSIEEKSPVRGAIVLLSIPDSIPYFDYCISDSTGNFCFYLRNAVGTGNLVIQARSLKYPHCEIKLIDNYIETEESQLQENMQFTYDQKKYAQAVINASYFNKFFTRNFPPETNNFSIPVEFKFPFYGEPTATVYPELFVDLPNFTEISRELLHGVQYREKKEGTSVKMYNYGGEEVFRDEPLKLLDGIPVFNAHVFSKMGTADIKKVDEIFYERFIGDLSFQGVLAVYSRKQSLSWIENTQGVALYSYPCLQPAKNWNLIENPLTKSNLPDFRKVFYRNKIAEIKPENEFYFTSSDLKGKIIISVIAITKQNKILYASKQIEVK